VVVSTLLVGLLLTASLVSVGAAARSTYTAANNGQAISLARQLLDEITVLPFEDPSQTPVFGLESGESIGPTGRTLADDIDDYALWNENPPTDRNGNPLAGFDGWTRSVQITPINGAAMYQILVTVNSPATSTSLTAYRSKVGGYVQSQGVPQTLVTWVGISLQSGTGDAVSGGLSLINHAADQ
jgi:hypothetical protein